MPEERNGEVSRKGLKNIENSSVEQKQWQSTKQKMFEYLKDKGYKTDAVNSESNWIEVLKREFQAPREKDTLGIPRYAMLPKDGYLGKVRASLAKSNESLSKKFSPQELKRIDEYILKVDSDLFRRTEFSKMPTIGEANPYAIPDRVLRASRQEWFKKLDDFFAAWDVLFAFVGAVTSVAGVRKTRMYIRGTEPARPKPIEEAPTIRRVVEPAAKGRARYSKKFEAKPAAGGGKKFEKKVRGRAARPETIEIARYSVENDPTLQDWRDRRNCTPEEFGNWLRNLPEETKVQFQLRLEEGGAVKKFVLRDAAHDIRVTRDLKLMGINQEHGDFVGPGGKAEKRIADKLSSSRTLKEDPEIKVARDEHAKDRVHHNPKTADDYLHQALDKYDAVTDSLRTKEAGGYKDPWNHDTIRSEFVEGETRDSKAKEAMKSILEWKEKGDGEELGKKIRQEYHETFKTLEKAEASIQTDKGALRIREKPQQKIGDRGERTKLRFLQG